MLKENLREVEGRVEAACKRAGRDVSEVTLIAVSKTKPVEDLQEIYDAGKRDFGENKVQELCAKMEVMPQDIKWHMIGHLQRNKVKYIVGNVALIHSVDSFRLAEGNQYPGKEKGYCRTDLGRGQHRRRRKQVWCYQRRCHGISQTDRNTGCDRDQGSHDNSTICCRCRGKSSLFSQNKGVIC